MPRFSIGDVVYLNSTNYRWTITDFSVLENRYALRALDKDSEASHLVMHCTVVDALFTPLEEAQDITNIDW